jgi:hypothetical protein
MRTICCTDMCITFNISIPASLKFKFNSFSGPMNTEENKIKISVVLHWQTKNDSSVIKTH